MRIQMVDLVNQHAKIESEYTKAMQDVIHSASFINGPAVKDFETAFAEYIGCRHALSCGNGTDALQIALMALDLKPGDEVITTAFTFAATAEVIKLLGLKPVFVDPDPNTFNIKPENIEPAITHKTRAIILVHLFGQAADMEALLKIARKHKLWLIEDAAQAVGAFRRFSDSSTKNVGTMGHIACTSFFPSKNLGAMGDGGALMTNDTNLAERIRQIKNHGTAVKYYHDTVGVNSRLDSLQAALLGVKLNYLDNYIEARRAAADFYDRAFQALPGIEIPLRETDAYHVFHQYTLKLEPNKRNRLKDYLKNKGIPSAIYYPVPLHRQKAYSDASANALPVSEKLSETVLSLPMHTELSENQLHYITETLIDYVKNY